MEQLTVYKASAGSGKTFTLASEYIILLIKNPYSYRNILAVTFTNKATCEMKDRILWQLYGISKAEKDSDRYYDKVKEALPEFSEPQIRERAGKALSFLLHHYNYFQVETIDKFFQQVLRNLARELNLSAGLRIDLNDSQIESNAVDSLIKSLTLKDKELHWITNYSNRAIDEERSWNVIKNIKDFGRQVFKDQYKQHQKAISQKLRDDAWFKSFRERLYSIRNNAEATLLEQCQKFKKAVADNGFRKEDFKVAPFSFFEKLEALDTTYNYNGTNICAAKDSVKSWLRAADQKPGAAIYELVETTLRPLLVEADDLRERLFYDLRSADITIKHLDELRLLDSIESEIMRSNEEANRFLLSYTQNILSGMIQDTDAPFIFEKIGSHLEHIMIDEFQDTGRLQWNNFRVLLNDCMSHGDASNLIVGDVKQSIYRWRDGDWRLLNNIEDNFPSNTIGIKTLERNWRSANNIISFNNAFFKAAVSYEVEEAKAEGFNSEGTDNYLRAYADVVQKARTDSPREGYVSVEEFATQKHGDTQEAMFARMVEIIRTLINDYGKSPSDIAILIRTKNDATNIVEYTRQHMPEVNIISTEAFRLSASTAVNIMVKALHVISHPNDKLAQATLATMYQREVLGNSTTTADLLISCDDPIDLLPKPFASAVDDLKKMPLFELTDRIYHLFEIERLSNQSAYICAYFDVVNDFISNYGSNIYAFLKEWDENYCDKRIQSDVSNGIRLMTIHASKGLEFDTVIMPSCCWTLENTQATNTIWCEAADAPYDELPLLPVDYSSRLMGTTYSKAYEEEHLQNMVDNMNLLYVGFTRPCQNLFVLFDKLTKRFRGATIDQVIRSDSFQEQLPDLTISEEQDTENDIAHTLYIYGTLKKAEANENESTEANTIKLQIKSYAQGVEYRQSNDSKNFIEHIDEDDIAPLEDSHYIQFGNVMHTIFSRIKTQADVPAAVKQLQAEGILFDMDLTPEVIERKLKESFSDSQIAEWFSEKWQLFNECSLIYVDPQTNEVHDKRPDRVMCDGDNTIVVDYKFGSYSAKHEEQVRQYMQMLQSMGYRGLKGYLWYFMQGSVKEVLLNT